MIATQGATEMTHTVLDPIDELIPRPRPWWGRLLVALVVVGLVGVGSFLWGQGYVRPAPDCCGSGNGSAMMSLSPDGAAVVVTAYVYNSSSRDLRIESATADLPGATVRGITVFPDSGMEFPPTSAVSLPAGLSGHGSRRLVITFTPDTCVDAPGAWGHVTMRLTTLNGWLPSVDRDYTPVDAVVEPGALQVFPPDDTFAGNRFTTPLAAACALLGRAA
jgi:hypothetical protein